MKIKKRLVFHFYWNNESENNLANKYHIACLSYYGDIFDEIVFVISLNKSNTQKEVRKFLRDKILDLFPNNDNITIKVIENSFYREAETFKKEVVDNTDFEGLIFFAHNKGITNVNNPIYDVDSVLSIIKGCYYLNLNFIGEIEYYLIDNVRPFFYGAFQQHSEYISTSYNEWYVGTFFWTNRNKIYKSIDLPKFYDRLYAESFPGNIGSSQNFHMICHNFRVIQSNDLLNAVTGRKLLEESLSDTEMLDFNKFSEEIEKRI